MSDTLTLTEISGLMQRPRNVVHYHLRLKKGTDAPAPVREKPVLLWDKKAIYDWLLTSTATSSS